MFRVTNLFSKMIVLKMLSNEIKIIQENIKMIADNQMKWNQDIYHLPISNNLTMTIMWTPA